jgi:hypothetical protein
MFFMHGEEEIVHVKSQGFTVDGIVSESASS